MYAGLSLPGTPSGRAIARSDLLQANRSNLFRFEVMVLPDSPERKRPLRAVFTLGMAGGPGFEPGLAESESAVLPLDDPP